MVTHLCWDNFDMREETPSGVETTHTAHGIIIQEVSENSIGTSNDNADPVTWTKHRSVKFLPRKIKHHVFSEPNLTILNTKVSNS